MSARVCDALTSLKLTLICLTLLMLLVVACTLAQVEMGSFAAGFIASQLLLVGFSLLPRHFWKPRAAAGETA